MTDNGNSSNSLIFYFSYGKEEAKRENEERKQMGGVVYLRILVLLVRIKLKKGGWGLN